MRILILTQYYLPEPLPKMHEFALGLRERGHEVVVVTGFPNYPQGRFYPGVRLRPWCRDRVDGVPVIRLPLFPDHSRSAVRRVLNYSSFALAAMFVGTLLCGRVDAMFVEHPPLTIGVVAWFVRWVRGAPYLYAVNDLWPESVTACGMVENRVFIRFMQWLERFTYARANRIAVISPGIKENLLGKGVPGQKVEVIPHWADESLYRPETPDPALARELGMAGRFNVVFAGQMGLAQALDVVLDAATELSDLPDVQFVLVGDGTDSDRLRRAAQERGLANVRFIGRQPAVRMPHIFAASQVLMVHLRDDPLFRITIPSKTMAYMACGRPLLMAVEGDAADLVRSTGAGVISPSENGKELAEAVRRLRAMPSEERENMGRVGREVFLASYSRRVLLDRYEAILTGLARGKSPRTEKTCGS